MATIKRRRTGFQSGTLGASLTSSGTTITFAAAPGFPTLGTDEYLAIVIESEIVYLTAYTAAATTGTIARGQEGTTGAAHSNGVAWLHGPTVGDMGGSSVTPLATQVGGNITSANTGATSAEIAAATGGPGTGNLDLTLVDVQAGQKVLLTANITVNRATCIDFATMVSGSVVNWVAQSAGALYATNNGIVVGSSVGTYGYAIPYTLLAGDIASGKVIFRPYYGTNGAGTIYRSVGAGPLAFSAVLLGF